MLAAIQSWFVQNPTTLLALSAIAMLCIYVWLIYLWKTEGPDL